jgi:hypothetical protein
MCKFFLKFLYAAARFCGVPAQLLRAEVLWGILGSQMTSSYQSYQISQDLQLVTANLPGQKKAARSGLLLKSVVGDV